MDLDAIKKHWNNIGNQVKDLDEIVMTSRDPYLGQLERENVSEHLPDCRAVLEIGCGDGAHTAHYAARAEQFHGLDVAESLLKIAAARMRKQGVKNVTFHCASVLDLQERFADQLFDAVISQRCIINLPTWDNQASVLKQVHELLCPGGIFLITEGFQDELENLNILRVQCGLEPITVVDNNRFMKRDDFELLIGDLFEIVAFRHYGLYTYLSHLFHPLAVLPDKPRHVSPLNETAMKLARMKPMDELQPVSYNLFYALRKK